MAADATAPSGAVTRSGLFTPDARPDVVVGEIALRSTPVLSLSFLVPLYLFLQLMLVPILFALASVSGVEVTFLYRFEALDEMLAGAALAACAIGAFLIGAACQRSDAPPFGHFDVDWDLDRALFVAYGIVFGNVAYRALNYFYLGGEFPESHYNNLIGPVWVGALIFPSLWQLYGVLIAVVAALVAPPDSAARFRGHAAFLAILLVSAGAVTRSRGAALTPLLCFWFVVALAGSDRVRRYVNGALLATMPLLLWLKFYVRSEAGAVEWSSTALVESLGEFLHRLSLNNVLAVVMQHFPDRYWGESFLTMFLINVTELAPAWVKDSFRELTLRPYVSGNEFGRVFGLTAEGDTATGMAIPAVGDVYLNFGVLGVAVCFLLYGVIAQRATNRLYGQPGTTVVFCFVALLPQMVPGMEHQVGTLLANVAKFAVFYIAVYTLIRRRDEAPEAWRGVPQAAQVGRGIPGPR